MITKIQYKIYIAIGIFLIISGFLSGYFFKLIDRSSNVIAESIQKKSVELKGLEAEQRSYEAGKKDLEKLKSLTMRPEDLFSRDTRLVKEIQTFELLANQNNLQVTLSISGSAADAQKLAKSTSNIFVIPYTMSVVGKYSEVIKFLDEMEHVPFVTHITNLQINTVTENNIRATLAGNFFIKK